MAVTTTDCALKVRRLPEEELRFALVLNGGVSLAVWMGGVAQEIDRLTRARHTDKNGYGPVLSAARTSVTVDIITGTSAGGINGAALALSQANERADLLSLRNLWAEQGRMEELLRSPFQGKPSSLLRGDDYFLPELNRAMRMLAHPFKARAGYTPLDLTLTTTLLKGDQKIVVDDFGERLPQRVHAATFRFTNITADGPPSTPEEDVFSEHEIQSTADAMALAARCTASFPFAFEPSFVPVGEKPPDGDLYRVQMDRFASWSREGGGPQSRYAVDGGVLANTPVAQALEAIDHRQAGGPVRRAMLLVFPHAPQATAVPPDEAGTPPRATAALASVFGALQSQGSRSFAERIENHNRQAGAWRGGREQIVKQFGAAGDEPVAGLYSMLEPAWSHYRHVRVRLAAAGLADKVRRPEQWSYERIRTAAEMAQQEWAQPPGEAPKALPYVPLHFAWGANSWQNEHLTNTNGWSWGDTPARGVAESVASVLRSALSVVTDRATAHDLALARQRAGEILTELSKARRDIDAVWLNNGYLTQLEPNKHYWQARIVAYERAMTPAPTAPDDRLAQLLDVQGDRNGARENALTEIGSRDGQAGRLMAQLVRDAVDLLVTRREALEDIGIATADICSLSEWWAFLFGPALTDEPSDDTDRVLLRLLALDAGTRLLAESSSTGSNLPIQLAELSLRVKHPWAQFSITPDDKAAGLELARFGGFLKRSWRMNDWTWGRLDAATMLCQMVLDPKRIRRIAKMSGLDVDEFAQAYFHLMKRRFYQGATLPTNLSFVEEEAKQELLDAVNPNNDDPLHLPKLATWAALPIQADIILEELPVLAAAIQVDVDDGTGEPTRGTRFLTNHKNGVLQQIAGPAMTKLQAQRTERLPLGCDALRAFDSAGIGREQLTEETGSDSLIRTISKAAGVLATVLDSDADKAPAAKPVTSAIRGAMLLPFWMVNGLAGGGAIAKFLATAGLIVGGVLLTLSLFGILGGATAAAGTIGAAAVLAALAYSALKTGSLLHAAALLAPVGALVAFALDSGADGKEAGTRVLVVLIAVSSLYILASIPWPLSSPLARVVKSGQKYKGRLKRKFPWVGERPHQILKRVGKLLVLALLTAFALALVAASAAGTAWVLWQAGQGLWSLLAEPVSFLRKHLFTFGEANWGWQVLGIVIVVTLGGALAYWQGALLRTWRPDHATVVHYAKADVVSGAFARESVTQPAGVAASWAPVYGAAYLLGAFALFHVAIGTDATEETWLLFTLWWLLAIGGLLCLVAPIPVAHAPRGRVLKLLRRSWPEVTDQVDNAVRGPDGTPPLPSKDDRSQLLLHTLLKYDLPYRYLAKAPVRASRHETTELVLTRVGERVRDHLEHDRMPAPQ